MKRVLLLLCLLTSVASAQSADDHVKAATDFYAVGNFEGALAEYQAAYQIDPKPEYLYAMATIEDQRGGCPAAIDYYQQFIATNPPADDVNAAQSAIDACKAKLGTHEKPKPVVVEKPVVVVEKPRMRRVKKSFISDGLGDVLVGAGLAGLGTGLVFDVLARSDAQKAAEPQPRDQYQQLWTRAQDRQKIAEIAAGVGAAFVVGGVVRWLTVDRWTMVPEAGGGAVSLLIASRW